MKYPTGHAQSTHCQGGRKRRMSSLTPHISGNRDDLAPEANALDLPEQPAFLRKRQSAVEPVARIAPQKLR